MQNMLSVPMDGGTVDIHVGDARHILQTLPPSSAHCCVTSPPYFGLRDYGVDGQIGREGSVEEYIASLVSTFRGVRRILRDDGTLWLNLGDSYSSGGRKAYDLSLVSKTSGVTNRSAGGARVTPSWAKPKDLLGIPWRVALALHADGWYLRQDIIWHKPNPMPESVEDRCTRSHEYIFLLSKAPKYYFDSTAIKEPLSRPDEGKRKTPARFGGADKSGDASKQSRLHSGNEYLGTSDGKRNKRSVWTVSTKPFKGAHFATFPLDLVEPCILAGCPVGGVVLDPFGGAGTTGLCAVKNNRNATLCELNREYALMAQERITHATRRNIPQDRQG